MRTGLCSIVQDHVCNRSLHALYAPNNGSEDRVEPGAGEAMRDLGYELRRIPILRASVNRPWIAARLRRSALGEEGPVEEEHVQTNDERDYDRGYRSGYAMVDQGTHHVVVAAEDQQRDEREGDAKGEHHLAYHQRATGVDPYGEDGQRGEHRDEATQEQRYPAVDEALHHHLPGHCPHRGAREA